MFNLGRKQVGGADEKPNYALQIIQYIVGLIVFIAAIYFAVTCKDADTLHIIAAICCSPCYVIYGFICAMSKKPAAGGF